MHRQQMPVPQKASGQWLGQYRSIPQVLRKSLRSYAQNLIDIIVFSCYTSSFHSSLFNENPKYKTPLYPAAVWLLLSHHLLSSFPEIVPISRWPVIYDKEWHPSFAQKTASRH